MPAIPDAHLPSAALKPKSAVHAPFIAKGAKHAQSQDSRVKVRFGVEEIPVKSKRHGKDITVMKIRSVVKANLSKIDPSKKGEVKLTILTGRNSDANKKIMYQNFSRSKDKALYKDLVKAAEHAIELYRKELPEYLLQREEHKGHEQEGGLGEVNLKLVEQEQQKGDAKPNKDKKDKKNKKDKKKEKNKKKDHKKSKKNGKGRK